MRVRMYDYCYWYEVLDKTKNKTMDLPCLFHGMVCLGFDMDMGFESLKSLY